MKRCDKEIVFKGMCLLGGKIEEQLQYFSPSRTM